jgi:hypothetical protein
MKRFEMSFHWNQFGRYFLGFFDRCTFITLILTAVFPPQMPTPVFFNVVGLYPQRKSKPAGDGRRTARLKCYNEAEIPIEGRGDAKSII